jgi:hypothetical protein
LAISYLPNITTSRRTHAIYERKRKKIRRKEEDERKITAGELNIQNDTTI